MGRHHARDSTAGTSLLLSHGGLTDQADVGNHARGWTGSLDRLPGVL